MLRHRIERPLHRPRHRRLAWTVAVAVAILARAGLARGGDAGVSSPTALPAPFGLAVARVPDLLREHLALGQGVGLVVNDVVAESPAAAAGFKQHDVLVSIDEQSLFVPEQLLALLAGETAAVPKSCTLIRNGQRQTIALASAAPLASAAGPAAGKTKRPLAAPASALAMLPDKKKARDLAAATNLKHVSGVVRRKGANAVFQEDLDYSINLSCTDEKLLTVRTARGKTIFRSVIETPEQRSLIPLTVRDRVEHLEQMLAREMQTATTTQPVAEIGSLDIEPVLIK